ncbi:MAG: hypothetical protein QOJ94_624 [Sphingomonadales bacterium]|jgi:hypothetical protein|nr:hypothetical protein [Sphingomonadales bacterium]
MLKALALAALLAAPATTGPPPPKPCVSKAQVRDMVMVLSPYVVDAVAKRCGPALPATAFVNAGAPALSARLKAESAGREASAVAALKVFAGDKVPPVQDQAALLTVMGQMMGAMATDKLPLDKCAGISEILQAVSPLPAENFGQLFATIIQMAGVGKDSKSPGICPGG